MNELCSIVTLSSISEASSDCNFSRCLSLVSSLILSKADLVVNLRPETGGTHASWRSYHVWGSTGGTTICLGKPWLPFWGIIFVGSKTLGEKQSFSRWQKRVMQLYKVFKKGFVWRKYVFFFQRLFISFYGSFESTLEQPDVLLFRFGKLCSEATWRDGMNVWYSHGLV